MNWIMVSVLVSVFIATNAGLVWAVKWLLARHREMISSALESIKASVGQNTDRNAKLREEFSSLRETLPRDYVRREDWIMSFSRIEQKIDAIWQFIHDRVSGGIDGP